MSGRLPGYAGGWIRFRLKSRRRVETGTGIGDLHVAIRAMKYRRFRDELSNDSAGIAVLLGAVIIEPSQV